MYSLTSFMTCLTFLLWFRLGIRLLPQEKEELAAIARRTDTTISQILREQIRNYINSHGGSCAVAAKENDYEHQ